MVHRFVALPHREFPALFALSRRRPPKTTVPPKVARFHGVVTIRALCQTSEQGDPSGCLAQCDQKPTFIPSSPSRPIGGHRAETGAMEGSPFMSGSYGAVGQRERDPH